MIEFYSLYVFQIKKFLPSKSIKFEAVSTFMSSFWQNKSSKRAQSIISRNPNQSLSSFHQTSQFQFLTHKASSNTIHQILRSSPGKINPFKRESIRRPLKRKQTLQSIPSRSTFGLVTKNRVQNTPIIDFAEALARIQQIFNEECNISRIGSKLKVKRFYIAKKASRLNELQNLSETNPKQQVRKQFDDIFRLFSKLPSKMHDSTKSINKEDHSIRSHKKSVFTFKESQTNEKNVNSCLESLTQSQRKVFTRQTKAFQKAQKHLMLKSYTVKIFYHHLNSQLALQSGVLEESLNSLYYCQYYARKIDFNEYIVPCLVMQAQVKQSMYEMDASIRILKTALEFTLVKRWKQLEMRVLEKISIIYYYQGNSYMAKYYKELSDHGLPQSEADIYIREYSKNEELKSLQARLFSLPYDEVNKIKNNMKYQMDISRDLFQDHDRMVNSLHQQVSSMLRNNKTTKIGVKLRRMIHQNCDKAEVRRFHHQNKSSQIVPRFAAFQYPIQNSSQVMKSHLSKSRISFNSQMKNVNFIKTLNFMKSLYKKLNNEISRQTNQENTNGKQNLPSINY